MDTHTVCRSLYLNSLHFQFILKFEGKHASEDPIHLSAGVHHRIVWLFSKESWQVSEFKYVVLYTFYKRYKIDKIFSEISWISCMKKDRKQCSAVLKWLSLRQIFRHLRGHALKFVYVLALYSPAVDELTREPPRMQPGLRPSVHMELKIYCATGRENKPTTQELWGLIFQPKTGLWHLWFRLCLTEFYLSLMKLKSSVH